MRDAGPVEDSWDLSYDPTPRLRGCQEWDTAAARYRDMNSFAVLVVSFIVGLSGMQGADPRDTSKSPGAIVGKWTIESTSGQKLSSIGQQGTIEFTSSSYTV